jgi:hypothetical protein
LIVVKKAVATNDFTALSQELLHFFDSAAGYHRAALYGTTDRLKSALAECLNSHNTDPPMFILQALMVVGNMAKTQGLDYEFVLSVSQFLVDVFCSPPPPPPLGQTTPPADEEFCFLGDDGDGGYGNSGSSDTGPSSGPLFLPDINLQSSTHTADSIDDSSAHNTNLAFRNVITKLASKNKHKKKKAADLVIWNDTDLLDLAEYSSLHGEKPLLLDFADSPIAHTTPHNKAAVQDKAFNIMDSNHDMVFIDLDDIQPSPTAETNRTLKAASTNISTHVHIPPPSPFDSVNFNRHFPEQYAITSEETHNRSIQPHHHQEVLNAILAHKSVLQIFLAIDAFELDPILLTYLFNTSHHDDKLLNENATYGSLVIIQLIDQGYIEEAAFLALRYPIGRSTDIDTKLAAGLVEMYKSDLLHEFVSDNKNLCRSVLHSINRRMTAQIWSWVKEEIIELDQLDHFHAVQCGRENTLAKASKTTRTTSACAISDFGSIDTLIQLAGLVETATRLGVKFELDNTMKTLQSLKLVTDLCTAITLLQQDQLPTLSETSAPSPSECAPSTMFQDASPTRSSEYQLTRPWKFIPVVVRILKNNVALQRLVIWYGIRIVRGLGTITFLASKLGQRAYLNRCLEQVNEQ